MRRLIGVAVAGLLGGMPSRAVAQVFTTLDANVSNATYDGYLSSAVYTLAPAVTFAGGPLRLGADGGFSEFQTGHASGIAEISTTVGTAIAGPLRWELSGLGSALWYRTNPAVLSGLVTPRLRVDQGPFVAWAGGSAGRTDDDSIHGHFVSRLEGGLAYAWPYVTPSFTVATMRAGIYHYIDFGGVVQTDFGRVALTANTGTRSGALFHGVATWFNAEARVTVWNGVALVGSGGSYPADPVRGAPGAHFIGFGVRWSEAFLVRKPPPPAIRYNALNGTSDVMPDARTLRFTAPANTRVELMADFTDWQPVPMTEVQPGLFQVTLPEPVRSGPHRVNIRSDNGDWTVPRELPPVVDDFGGKAGALVVP